MSSWAHKAKRDGLSLSALSVAIVLTSTLLPQMAPTSMERMGPGPRPFYWALQNLDDLLPWMPSRDHDISLVGLALLVFAAVGLFYAAWRLTRNRIVSLGAGFLLAAHPLARAALVAPSGLGDLINLAFVAWALALAAGPRQRSSRFPNRPPRPLGAAMLALLGVAALTTPQALVLAALIFLFDLFFQREPNRPALERNWRGYIPLGFFAAGLMLMESLRAFIVEPATHTLGLDHSERLVATLAPGLADSIWMTLLMSIILVVGLGIAALDLLFNLGRRRLMLPWIGFAATAAFVAWFFVGTGDQLYTQKALQGFVGFAFLMPVLAWRLVMRFLPVKTAAAIPAASVEPWEAKVARLGLQEVPDLVGVPAAARVEDWQENTGGMTLAWKPLEAPVETLERKNPFGPELQAALERLGRDAQQADRPRADRSFAGSELVPALEGARDVLALLPSQSPYASIIAETHGDFILLEQVAAERPGFAELQGMKGVRQFEHDGRQPWPSQSESVDLVVISDVAENLNARSLQMVFTEAARILRPEGRLLLRYPVFEKSAPDSNAMPIASLEAFIELGGLALLERRDQAQHHILELLRGDLS